VCKSDILGNKRNEIGDGTNGKPDQIDETNNNYGDCEEIDTSRMSVSARVW